MKLGKIQINGKAVLAPMAGVTDRAFRELCMGYGAAYCVSEMVSAKGLIMSDRKTAELLAISEEERPMAIQLFGYEPEVMAEAARIAAEHSPAAAVIVLVEELQQFLLSLFQCQPTLNRYRCFAIEMNVTLCDIRICMPDDFVNHNDNVLSCFINL